MLVYQDYAVGALEGSAGRAYVNAGRFGAMLAHEGQGFDGAGVFVFQVHPTDPLGVGCRTAVTLPAVFRPAGRNTDVPDFRVLVGVDQQSPPRLGRGRRAGGPGCISATANVNAGALRELYDNWQSDRADAIDERVRAVRAAAESKPAIPALKAVLARQQGADGWLNLRPPLVGLDAAQEAELFDALEAAGYRLARAAAE